MIRDKWLSTVRMNKVFSSIVRSVTVCGVCIGTALTAVEIDRTGNDVFDLYFFGNNEAGMLGLPMGVAAYDDPRLASGHVKDSLTYYWSDELKQAMVNAVNTWTTVIDTPYDDTVRRKLRIGFFLDDASAGGVMDRTMAGYARTKTVVTNFEEEYGSGVNIYSIAEWAWRDNNVTSGYAPDWAVDNGSFWETELLPDSETINCIDIVIALNPVIASYGFDAQGYWYNNEMARSLVEMQNIATHEIGHAMGMDSYMFEQKYDMATNTSSSVLSGYISTWDSLLTLEGEDILKVENGAVQSEFTTLDELHRAAWEPIPSNPDDYTFTELQYDPERRLSLNGELGVHIASIALEGDTLEHLSYGDGSNVLGPGGTANGVFSAEDLRALEILGWSVRRDTPAAIPEPATTTLFVLVFAGLASRRRRR